LVDNEVLNVNAEKEVGVFYASVQDEPLSFDRIEHIALEIPLLLSFNIDNEIHSWQTPSPLK